MVDDGQMKEEGKGEGGCIAAKENGNRLCYFFGD